jgi:putative inorganic carbon (HCO3(-)) transporter
VREVARPSVGRPALDLARGWGGTPAALGIALALGALIGLLPPAYGLALAAGGTLFLIGLARPTWPLYLLGLAAPLGSVREIRVGGVGVSATEGLVAVALIAYALSLLSRRDASARLSPWSAPIALFLLVGLLSTGWVASASAAAKELLRWLELGGAFALVVALVRDARQARGLLFVLLLGGLAESLVGAVQFLLQIGPPSFEVGRFLRAYGTFGQPNPYGGYLAMILPVAVAIVWTSLPLLARWRSAGPRRLAWPAYALLVAAACAIGLGMSLSRGAWLGATAGLLALMMAGGRRSLLTVLVGLFVGALVALLGAFEALPASAVERVTSITRYFGIFDVREVTLTSENWAVVERMAHWQAALRMWEASPWLGVGIGQYAVRYEDYFLPGWLDPLGHAHNYYLNVLAETGLLGLASYLLMVLSWLAMTYRLARGARTPLARAVGLGVLGVATATATHNLFDNLYVAGMNVHLGLLLGLAAGAGRWEVADVRDGIADRPNVRDR